MSVRGRLLAALLLAGTVAAGGASFERWVGIALPPAEPGPGLTTGAWVCPHGGGEGWRVWITLANPAKREVRFSMRVFGPEGVVSEEEGEVPGGAVRAIEVPAQNMAAGTLVETFGGRLAVGMGMARPAGGGSAAEPCAAQAGREWYLPGGTSERGRGAWIVAVNPSASDAAFEVTLAGETRALQPGALRGIVLPAGRALALDLNRFALGERALAATVRVSLGRVAVAAVGVDDAGVRSAIGVPALSRQWFLPAGAEDVAGSLGLLSGRRETPFRAALQDAASQEVLTDVSVQPLRAGTFELAGPGGLAVRSEGRATFAAARRIARPGVADEAAGAGAPAPAPDWVALPPGPEEAGPGRLIVQNPTAGSARVRITVLEASGGGGRVLEPIEVGPSQTEDVDLGASVQGLVAVLVESDRGEVVVARSVLWPGGFAMSVGIPVRAL